MFKRGISEAPINTSQLPSPKSLPHLVTGKASPEATAALTETYAAVGVVGKLLGAAKHLLHAGSDASCSRAALRLASKLVTRLVHTPGRDRQNPGKSESVMGQLEAALTSESGLCRSLLDNSETKADCLSWIDRLLQSGRGVDLAVREVVPVMGALAGENPGGSASNSGTVRRRLFACLCAVRELRPEVGMDLQALRVLALGLQEGPAGELRRAAQEAVRDLSNYEIIV